MGIFSSTLLTRAFSMFSTQTTNTKDIILVAKEESHRHRHLRIEMEEEKIKMSLISSCSSSSLRLIKCFLLLHHSFFHYVKYNGKWVFYLMIFDIFAFLLSVPGGRTLTRKKNRPFNYIDGK
jgi:hypothetical protein